MESFKVLGLVNVKGEESMKSAIVGLNIASGIAIHDAILSPILKTPSITKYISSMVSGVFGNILPAKSE